MTPDSPESREWPPTVLATAPRDLDEIDLGQLWRSLMRRWRLIGLATAAGIMVAFIVVLHAQPIFESNGSLYLGEVAQNHSLPGAGGLNFLSGLMQSSGMATQIDILRSRDLVDQAILQTGLNAAIHRVGYSPMRFWSWRFEGENIRRFGPKRDQLKAFFTQPTDPALADTRLAVRFGNNGRYRIWARGHLVVHGTLNQPAVGSGLRILLAARVAGNIPAPGRRYDLRVFTPTHVFHKILHTGALGISAPSAGGASTQKTQIANVTFKTPNPYTGQRFVAQLMADYLAQSLRWTTDQAAGTYSYLNGQLAKIRHSLSTADQKLAAYQRHSGVIAPTADAKAMISQLSHYQLQKTALQLRLYSLQEINRQLQGPHGRLRPYLLNEAAVPMLTVLGNTLTKAQTHLALLRAGYTARAPQVRSVQAQIDRIKSEIRRLIGNQRVQAEQDIAAINRVMGRFRREMRTLPQAELTIVALSRSATVLGKIYMYLLQKQEEAAISKAVTVSKNRVLNIALAHNHPVTPVAKRDILLGGFLGLFLGVGFVLGQMALTSSFRSDEEIRAGYEQLPLYAILPHLSRPRGPAPTPGFGRPDPRTPFAEAIRILRSNLYLSLQKTGSAAVLFTSAGPAEGKSTIARHLALALAEDGRKVLLIDGDLRKPQLHTIFGIRQEPGLSSLLTARHTLAEAIWHDAPSGLFVLTAGALPPNPAELVSSERLPAILTEACALYDFVLIDGPPFPLVGDALILGRSADRVLSIVRVNRTHRRAFRDHIGALLAVGHRLGLVINDVDAAQGYGYGYGYGYGEGADKPRSWRKRLQGLISRRG